MRTTHCPDKQSTWLQFSGVDLRLSGGGYETEQSQETSICFGTVTAITEAEILRYDSISGSYVSYEPPYYVTVNVPFYNYPFPNPVNTSTRIFNDSWEVGLSYPQLGSSPAYVFWQPVWPSRGVANFRVVRTVEQLNNPNCVPRIVCTTIVYSGNTQLKRYVNDGSCPNVQATCGCGEDFIECAPVWEPDHCCLSCSELASQISGIAAQVRSSECWRG